MRNFFLKKLCSLFILVCLWLLGSELNAQVIARSVWFEPLRSNLSTAGVRISNFTPRRHEFNPTGERAYLRPNDCFFRVDFNRVHYRLPFGIDMVEGGPDNRCKAYINEWNSNTTTVFTRLSRLVVAFRFEEVDTELITDCYNNFCCDNALCPNPGCPDLELARGNLEIIILPILSSGRLTYEAEVVFTVDVHGYTRIRTEVENQVRRQIYSTSIRTAIEASLEESVRRAGIDLHRVRGVVIDRIGNLQFF